MQWYSRKTRKYTHTIAYIQRQCHTHTHTHTHTHKHTHKHTQREREREREREWERERERWGWVGVGMLLTLDIVYNMDHDRAVQHMDPVVVWSIQGCWSSIARDNNPKKTVGTETINISMLQSSLCKETTIVYLNRTVIHLCLRYDRRSHWWPSG